MKTGNSGGLKLNEVCYIRHSMQTELDSVGLQVWNGALYMCDYILANQHLFTSWYMYNLGDLEVSL